METIAYPDDEVTVAAFERWLGNSRSGSKFVYHTGNLAADRESVALVPQYSGYVHVIHEPFHSLGELAWLAYERRVVTLAQRRVSPTTFDYIAFKRKPRKQR